MASTVEEVGAEDAADVIGVELSEAEAVVDESALSVATAVLVLRLFDENESVVVTGRMELEEVEKSTKVKAREDRAKLLSDMMDV